MRTGHKKTWTSVSDSPASHTRAHTHTLSHHTLVCPYQAGGDHLLKPLGLRLVIQVDAAHQIIPCWRMGGNKQSYEGVHSRNTPVPVLLAVCNTKRPAGGVTRQVIPRLVCHACRLLHPAAQTVIRTQGRGSGLIMDLITTEYKKGWWHILHPVDNRKTLIEREIRSGRKRCWSASSVFSVSLRCLKTNTVRAPWLLTSNMFTTSCFTESF